MQTIRVLMVDDNAEFLEAAERFVSTIPNVRVVGNACSGKEALKSVDALTPTLVLMGYVMPDMNGIEATRRIKRLPGGPRVVILTLHDVPEYHLQAKEAGADGFLSKVDFVTDLLPMIDSLFKHSPELSNEATAKQAQPVPQNGNF